MYTRYVVKYKPDTLPRQNKMYTMNTPMVWQTLVLFKSLAPVYTLLNYNCNIGPSVTFTELGLVYLPKGKYCVYPRMVYRLAIVMTPPPPILDDRKWILITFLAIWDQYATFPCFVHKMAAGGHFGLPKITFDRISRHFRSIRNFYFFEFVHKMAAGGHFGWPKMIFDRISRHFRSIRNFYFFHKMAASGHFGWPKITFDSISCHIKSMRNFDFFCSQNGCRRPFWITEDHFWFLAITDQYATSFFHKMAASGHFRWPKITFDRISHHFRSIRNFYYFDFFSQNGCRRPFWMTKNHFQSHFSPFQINTQLLLFFTKWLPVAILDDRNSLLIAFLAISDQYATFIFLFTKWLPAAIFFFLI